MAAAHGTVAVESLLSKLHSLNTMQYGLNEKIAADTLEQAHKARLVAIQLRLFQEAETVARSLCSQVAVALPETPIDAEPMESVFEWLLQKWRSSRRTVKA